MVDLLTSDEQKAVVAQYIKETQSKSERDRISEMKTKSGVFTGSYAKHPVTHELIPIWIADYVLMGFGSGAVMGVPAHDERDLLLPNSLIYL